MAAVLRIFTKSHLTANILQPLCPSVAYFHTSQVRDRRKPPSQYKWRHFRWAKNVQHPREFWFDDMRRRETMTMDEMRKERHTRKMADRPIEKASFREIGLHMNTSGQIADPYVPPEGDGKASVISTGKGMEIYKRGKESASSMNATRKIKKFDPDFKKSTFPQHAQDIYVEALKLLENYKENEDRIHELVSELAYPNMVHKLDKKTLRWRFIESLEPPRVVNVATDFMFDKNLLYGQVTVRFHTRQTLAIYDRFGRLMFGSEHQVRDVLEYIVFEKFMANEYGTWRIHGKVEPEWAKGKSPHEVLGTFRRPNVVAEDIPESETDISQTAA